MELTEIHKSVLAECAYDDVGLWSIIRRVHGESYPRDSTLPDRVRRETMVVVRDLLEAGLIEAGRFEKPEGDKWHFRSSDMPAGEAAAYIEREWDKLGRTPGPGEVCWFRATLAGKQLAKELGLKGY